MKNKIPIKSKIIIFMILTLVAIGSIAYNKTLNIKHNNENVESMSKDNKEKNKEAEKEDEKTKKLEQKCEEGKKAFFDKKYDQAIKMQNEVIKEDPNFYKAYNIKGITLCYKGNFEEGMKNIDKSLEIKPNFGYARFNKALAYELYNKYDDALKWYDKALEIEQYEWSYYGKASIYGRRKDVENTVKYLKKAIEMCPDVKEEAKHEADFDNVRDSKEFKDLIK